MSQPPNPLDAFRTYSYHHILIAADSTKTAERIADDSELSKFDHSEVRFCPQSIDGGRYVVLANGLTDSQFVVQSAKWSTVPIPNTGSTTSSAVTSVQTMAVDGEVEILEPQGVNFFNVLVEVTKMMGIDPALVIFVLKTVFIGHRDDGTTSMITTIRPLIFIMVDITAKIDVAGSVYTMALVGIANGAAKLPHVNAVVEGFTFNVESELGPTFEKLESEIGDKYDDMWKDLVSKKDTCGVKFEPEKFSRVKYKFDLQSDYKGYKCGDIKDIKFKDTSDEGGYVANLGDGASIENIISAIMMSSEKVVLEAKGKLPDNRYMFKIASTVRTEADTGLFEVTYHIHRYKAVVVEVEDFLTFEPEVGMGITFDYIFTGKNIDIIDLNIKMEYGLMFFQVLSVEGTSPTNAVQVLDYYNPDLKIKASGADAGLGAEDMLIKSCENTGKKDVKKPLFLGTTIRHPLFRDTSAIGASAGFNATLNRHAAIENLGLKMTIRGNPQLLEDTTQMPKDLSTSVSSVPQVIEPEGLTEQLRNIMPRIHKIPAYVKVNIWSPKSWTGSSAKSEVEKAASYEGDYAENLWYDGWYYMIQINHVFDGDFRQELELVSLPTEFADTETDGDCTRAESKKESKKVVEKTTSAVEAAAESITPESGKAGSSSSLKDMLLGDLSDFRSSEIDKAKAPESKRIKF